MRSTLLNNVVYYILLSVVFVTPLIFWNGFLFSSTFTKTLFFISTVDIALILWLPIAFEKRRRLTQSAIGIAVILFMGVAVVSSVAGADFYQSIWSNYERMMGLWTIAHGILFFLMIITVVDKSNIVVFMRVAVCSAGIVSLIGINEMIKGGGAIRIESTLYNSAFLASYLLLSSFIAFWLMVGEKYVKYESIIWSTAFILMIVTVFFTGTRGAIIALMVGFVFMIVNFLLLAPRDGRTLSMPHGILKKIAVGILIIIICSIVTIFLLRERLSSSSFDPIGRIASISISDRTFVGRMLAWKVAWSGWKEHLLLGWGIENYHLLFDKYYDAKLYEQEPWYDRAHNFIFDVGSTAGFLGLVAYLGIFGTALFLIFALWRDGRVDFWFFAVFVAALISYLFQNLFVFDTLPSLISLFVILALIDIKTSKELQRIQINKKTMSWLTTAAFFLVILMLYIGAWKPARENYYGKLAYDAFAKSENDNLAIKYTQQALSYNTYGNIDVRRGVAEYIFEYLKNAGHVRDEDSLKRVFLFAIEKMEENIREKPLDVKWYMYQGQLYSLAAVIFEKPNLDFAKLAESRFVEAKRLSPGRPQIYLEIAQARKVLGDKNGVWEAIDEIKQMLPGYSAIHINALVHAIDLRDVTREVLEKGWLEKSGGYDYYAARDAYARNGRFSEAADMQKLAIDSKEKDSSYDRKSLAEDYKNLAVFYKESGNVNGARSAALRVIELDPARRAAAEAFLQSLDR